MTPPPASPAAFSAAPALAPALAPATVRADAWRPGVSGGDVPHGEVPHGEVFASGREAAGAALALAFARDRLRAAASDPVMGDTSAQAARDWPDQRAWLWVQDKAARRLAGRPYRAGLPCDLRHRLVHVAATTPEDALFAIEEGLRCRDLAFVIGEIAGNPRALSFTASRRLSLAAQRHGVPLWLVRIDAARDLSSARMRWDVRAAASPPPRWNPQAPGVPSWQASLFRARRHPPGEWLLRDRGKGGLEHFPLPARGEDTQAGSRSGLAGVGEGAVSSRMSQTPLQASLAAKPASCATLSPFGERERA